MKSSIKPSSSMPFWLRQNQREEASAMASFNGSHHQFIALSFVLTFLLSAAEAADIFLSWNVSFDESIKPVGTNQQVLTINGMFPGPLISATTDDSIHVDIYNNLDEPFLMTWNGIRQRGDSWQDGVSGTNCPILPGKKWTYAFQLKDETGSFFYFPSTRMQSAAGGFGPIGVYGTDPTAVPFAPPAADFHLLIGDWNNFSFKFGRAFIGGNAGRGPAIANARTYMLINGKMAYNNSLSKAHESLEVEKGKTYRLRIHNVGQSRSFNFKIQSHPLLLVEAEGSYTDQITLDSLDVHVGQSYSVIVTANQSVSDYFIVASAYQTLPPADAGVALLHYKDSTSQPSGPLPAAPSDANFSLAQAINIRFNSTTSAASQGTFFNLASETIGQTLVLHAGTARLSLLRRRFTVNNVSYLTPATPPKLADFFRNGTGVYTLDQFPVNSIFPRATVGTFIATGNHRTWAEVVLVNELDSTNSWHLDGFRFFVVGFGIGNWSTSSRETYNLHDPVYRSTVQVYGKGWTAIYVYLDNAGMWNLRSQILTNRFLGQELYLRVHDPLSKLANELPPPGNLILCGIFDAPAPAPSPI